MNYEQAITKAKALGKGASVEVTIVTNQDDGLVSYIKGSLSYIPSGFTGYYTIQERLSTTGSEPLKALYSDRTIRINLPGEGGFVEGDQPFNIGNQDKIGLSISKDHSTGGAIAKFKLINAENFTFQVLPNNIGSLMYGLGPTIGNGIPIDIHVPVPQALYSVSFNSVELKLPIG